MPISINIHPAKLLAAGEKSNNAKLNQMAAPTADATGTIAAGDMASGDYSAVFASGPYFYGLDTGAANTAQVALSPIISAYVDGLAVAFKVAAANTGAATLSVNGLAAAPVRKHGNVALDPGDWKRGQIVLCRYQLDASVVPGGALYSGAGSYVLPVIIGKTYTWTKGVNDTSLVNGVQTLLATGSFTATGSTVTLNGTIAGSITATVVPDSNVWQMLSQLGNSNKQYPFQPASAYLAGEAGLVPQPRAGDQVKYLRGDGTWVDVLALAVAANAALNTNTEIFKMMNFS